MRILAANSRVEYLIYCLKSPVHHFHLNSGLPSSAKNPETLLFSLGVGFYLDKICKFANREGGFDVIFESAGGTLFDRMREVARLSGQLLTTTGIKVHDLTPVGEGPKRCTFINRTWISVTLQKQCGVSRVAQLSGNDQRVTETVWFS